MPATPPATEMMNPLTSGKSSLTAGLLHHSPGRRVELLACRGRRRGREVLQCLARLGRQRLGRLDLDGDQQVAGLPGAAGDALAAHPKRAPAGGTGRDAYGHRTVERGYPQVG